MKCRDVNLSGHLKGIRVRWLAFCPSLLRVCSAVLPLMINGRASALPRMWATLALLAICAVLVTPGVSLRRVKRHTTAHSHMRMSRDDHTLFAVVGRNRNRLRRGLLHAFVVTRMHARRA